MVSPNTIGSTRPNTEAKATPSASSRIGVAQGCSRIAVVRMRNSLAKTPNGGMPRIASEPSISPQPTVGLTLIRPRISSITCVPAFCAAWPTAKKIAHLVSECTVMCSRPAKFAIGPPMPNANVDQPHVLDRRVGEHALDVPLARQEERGDDDRDQAEAHHQLAGEARSSAPSASTLQRSSAYSATLSSSPESTAETGVGPSACASGSQLCSGTSPTLVP